MVRDYQLKNKKLKNIGNKNLRHFLKGYKVF
jgi:hypothetical protein